MALVNPQTMSASPLTHMLREMVSEPSRETRSARPPVSRRRYANDRPSVDQSHALSDTLITVFAADVAPSVSAANAMGVALQEMNTCKHMFDQWADTLSR